MNKAAYDKITALLRNSSYRTGSTVIFCAPTPVLGPKLFEQGQLDMVDQTFNMSKLLTQHFPRPTGRWENDFESWGANPRSRYHFFFHFLDTIVQPSNVIILSGDACGPRLMWTQ